MAQPTPYVRQTDFSTDESGLVAGRSTVRTARVDAELDALGLTANETRVNLGIIQRDDTKLRDGAVELHTLAADVRALLATVASKPRGAWLTATAYAVGDLVIQSTNTYLCAVAHTSGTFATDLTAVRWMLVALGSTVAASAVSFAPTATLAATNVQAAIAEADTENRALSAAAWQAVLTALVDLASTASGKGDALVGVKLTATGSASRTQHDKNAERVTFTDFSGVDPTGVSVSTAGMQAAIDAVALLGGGVLYGVPGHTYKIDAALNLKTFVKLDLCGATVIQATSNTPIFQAPTSGDIQWWGLRNGRLQYSTQQVAANTEAIGVKLANSKLSYNWFVEDVCIDKCHRGVASPATSGSFAFVGRLTNIVVTQFADWAIDLDCDAASGANTNVTITNCWALQTSGAAIAGSKGIRLRAMSMCNLVSFFGDYLQGPLLEFTNCDGYFGNLTYEAGALSASSGSKSLLTFSECSGIVNIVKLVTNTFTVTGAGEIYFVRPTTASSRTLTINDFVTEGNTYSGAAIYEVNPSSGMTVLNNYARFDRTVSLVDAGTNKLIKRWNGVDRGIGRGTTAQRPVPTADAIGRQYMDNTLDVDGKPIWWNGTVWVDATGAVV